MLLSQSCVRNTKTSGVWTFVIALVQCTISLHIFDKTKTVDTSVNKPIHFLDIEITPYDLFIFALNTNFTSYKS